MATIKATKIQKFDALKTMLVEGNSTVFDCKDGKYTFDLEEALAFIDAERDLLVRKNANTTEKQTEKQKQAEIDRELILTYLRTAGKPASYMDLQRNISDFFERAVTGNYISSIVKPLIDSGEIEKEKVNNKVCLKLPVKKEG